MAIPKSRSLHQLINEESQSQSGQTVTGRTDPVSIERAPQRGGNPIALADQVGSIAPGKLLGTKEVKSAGGVTEEVGKNLKDVIGEGFSAAGSALGLTGGGAAATPASAIAPVINPLPNVGALGGADLGAGIVGSGAAGSGIPGAGLAAGELSTIAAGAGGGAGAALTAATAPAAAAGTAGAAGAAAGASAGGIQGAGAGLLALFCNGAAVYYPMYSQSWFQCRQWLIEGWTGPVAYVFRKWYLKHNLWLSVQLRKHPTLKKLWRPFFTWAHSKGTLAGTGAHW